MKKRAPVRLHYHFTSAKHWRKIWEDGFLDVTESNVSRKTPHAGPDVVWLTTKESVGQSDLGLAGSAVDKSRVRFTVEVSAEKWFDFADKHGVDRDWRDRLGRGNSPSTWRLSLKPIPREAWREVRDMKTNVVLWSPVVTVPTFPIGMAVARFDPVRVKPWICAG